MLTEVRKEDDLYFQGAFWINANSVKDILSGQFEIVGQRLLSTYEGKYVDDITSKSAKTHRKLWEEYKSKLDGMSDKEYTYLPRGRVSIYKGTAYIHIHSRMNIPKVIDAITSAYELKKLDIIVDLNDTYQGSHYESELQ